MSKASEGSAEKPSLLYRIVMAPIGFAWLLFTILLLVMSAYIFCTYVAAVWAKAPNLPPAEVAKLVLLGAICFAFVAYCVVLVRKAAKWTGQAIGVVPQDEAPEPTEDSVADTLEEFLEAQGAGLDEMEWLFSQRFTDPVLREIVRETRDIVEDYTSSGELYLKPEAAARIREMVAQLRTSPAGGEGK